MFIHSRYVTALTLLLAALGSMAAPGVARAQSAEGAFPKASLELRGGVVAPTVAFTGYDNTWEPGSTGTFGANFDARPTRFLGLDVGVDVALHAFGAGGSIDTTGGARGVTDQEILFTLGPRLIIPSASDQLLFSLGGGYAYVRYDELAATQGNEIITGFSGGSRGGSGGYLFGQIEFATSPNGPVTFGLRVGTVMAQTEGTTVGSFPGGYKARDSWPTVVGTLAFRFGK